MALADNKAKIQALLDAINAMPVITSENIISALGYTPADAAEVDQLSAEMVDVPKVFIDGTIPTTKDDVLAEMTYVSKTETFHAYLKIKCQGTSSMSYPKKNFTVNLYSDEARETKLKKVFRDWGVESSKFVLKANYIDHSHARNIVCANLWDEVVSCRADYDTLPDELRNSPRNGAIDGFPIKVYTNGTYQGIYTWNIGKDAWMWGMNEDNPNHVLLCGETNTDGVYAENACNFRALWSGTDGNDWSVEVGANSDALKTSLNNLISCVKDTDDATFEATIGNYLDVQSAIDYFIQQYVTCGIDNLAKNMLLGTYDGVKWYCGSYDMDSTIGLTPQGATGVVTYDYACPEQYKEQFSLLWERLVNCYYDEIKIRYAYLRKTVFAFSNMVTKFERFMDVIGLDLFEEDGTLYNIPSLSTNNIQYIRKFVRDRLAYADQKIPELAYKISCTGITLDQNALSFISYEPITLTATVTPVNTTESIVWESSNTSVATVSQGVVTPISNGECVITATCGYRVAECSVSVGTISLASQIKWIDNTYVNGVTGNAATSNDDSATDYVNLNGAKHILYGDARHVVKPTDGYHLRASFYDGNKTHLGHISSYSIDHEGADLPDNAVYARFTIKSEDKGTFFVTTDVDMNGFIKLNTELFVENRVPSASGDTDAGNTVGYYDELIPVSEGQWVVYPGFERFFKAEGETTYPDKKIAFYDESGVYKETKGFVGAYCAMIEVPAGVGYVKFIRHNTCKNYSYYKVLG